MVRSKNTVYKTAWQNAYVAREQQKEITVQVLSINVGKAKAKLRYTWAKNQLKQ